MASDRAKTVGEVAQFKNSLRKPVTSTDRKPGPYPYYGAATIQDWVDGYLFEGLHVLVGEDGTVQTSDGRPLIQLVDGKFWVNNHAHVLTCDSASDTRFLAYALNQIQIAPFVTGAAQPKLNMGNLKRIHIAWPDHQVRKEISEVGKHLDDRIDNLRQTNATLESIAKALFKSWFVDFDPVRAKAERREPEGMDAVTAALFPSGLVDSELGLVPEGWKVDEIGNLVNCLGGGTPSTKDEAFWGGGGHHWATPKDLSGLQVPVLSSTARKITDAGLARISSGLLPVGTLLMSSRAPIGYLAIAAVPTAINQGFIAIPPGRALPPAYLLFWAKANMDLIKQKANGSTFMEISRRAFRPIKVLLPPPEILAAFMSTASPILNRIKENERHGAVLAETRDTLLPRLISGKLNLHAAEREIEAATA